MSIDSSSNHHNHNNNNSNSNHHNNTNDTTGSSDRNEEDMATAVTLTDRDTMYQTLARQIEYYFSSANLMVDTYLQTLRELNDGCVPVTIMANFSKVKMIVQRISTTKHQGVAEQQQQRIDAVLHVIQQAYCHHLQIYSIDSRTGKIITSMQHSPTNEHNNNNDVSSSTTSNTSTTTTTNTILAIGFKHGCTESTTEQITLTQKEPINNNNNNNNKKSDIVVDSTTTTTTSTSVSLDETNTLILRDVDSNVSECEIRSIFDMIGDCPTIVKIVPDIAACWFVTFETTDRYDLIRVMMQLRTMTYPSNGDPVTVRLRASVVPSQSTIIRVDSYDHHRHNMVSTIHNMVDPCIVPKKKRRRKKRSKNKKNKTTSTTSVATTTSLAASDASVTDTATANKESSPLDLSHDDFPTLSRHHSGKVEWSSASIDMVNGSINDDIEDEVSRESSTNKDDECSDGDEEEMEDNDLEVKLTSKLRLHHSDTASTATTTSSNASSGSDTVQSAPYHGENNETSPTVLSGYAAALLRGASSPMGSSTSVPVSAAANLPVVAVGSVGCMDGEVTATFTSNGKDRCCSELPSSVPSISDSPHPTEDHRIHQCTFTETAVVTMPQIKWGSRRSFVDVIREGSSNSSSMKQ